MSYQVVKTLSPSFGKTNLALTLKCVFSLSNSLLWYPFYIQDHYRIIVFEGSESLNSGTPLKTHLTLVDGPHRPSDRFLRLHFRRCLAVSVCRGSVMEDYREQEIDLFMEELGVYDNEINPDDPGWSTPLGSYVHAYLIRQKMAE
jgi:hypothetical protein